MPVTAAAAGALGSLDRVRVPAALPALLSLLGLSHPGASFPAGGLASSLPGWLPHLLVCP